MSPLFAPRRAFLEALALNFVWINVSETLRWFLVVRPMVRADFAAVPGVAPDTPAVGALWIVWDLLLVAVTTVICRLALERLGPGLRAATAAGTLVWLAAFVLLWLGVHNMGLATPRIVLAALPLAWFELVVAASLTAWRMRIGSRLEVTASPS